MAAVLRVGGAEGMTTTKVSKRKLLEKIQENPRGYRIGATTRNRINRRFWNYRGEYDNKTVYYARTTSRSCLKKWENEALALLPEDHQYNIQKRSNMTPGDKGFLYIIDMQ